MAKLKEANRLFDELKTDLNKCFEELEQKLEKGPFDNVSTANAKSSNVALKAISQELESRTSKIDSIKEVAEELLTILDALDCKDTPKGHDIENTIQSVGEKFESLKQVIQVKQKKFDDKFFLSIQQWVLKNKRQYSDMKPISVDKATFRSQVQNYEEISSEVKSYLVEAEAMKERHQEKVAQVKKYKTLLDNLNTLNSKLNAQFEAISNIAAKLETFHKAVGQIESWHAYAVEAFQGVVEMEALSVKVDEVCAKREEKKEHMLALSEVAKQLFEEANISDEDKLQGVVDDLQSKWNEVGGELVKHVSSVAVSKTENFSEYLEKISKDLQPAETGDQGQDIIAKQREDLQAVNSQLTETLKTTVEAVAKYKVLFTSVNGAEPVEIDEKWSPVLEKSTEVCKQVEDRLAGLEVTASTTVPEQVEDVAMEEGDAAQEWIEVDTVEGDEEKKKSENDSKASKSEQKEEKPKEKSDQEAKDRKRTDSNRDNRVDKSKSTSSSSRDRSDAMKSSPREKECKITLCKDERYERHKANSTCGIVISGIKVGTRRAKVEDFVEPYTKKIGLVKFFEKKDVIPHVFVGVPDEETVKKLIYKLDRRTLVDRRVDVKKAIITLEEKVTFTIFDGPAFQTVDKSESASTDDKGTTGEKTSEGDEIEEKSSGERDPAEGTSEDLIIIEDKSEESKKKKVDETKQTEQSLEENMETEENSAVTESASKKISESKTKEETTPKAKNLKENSANKKPNKSTPMKNKSADKKVTEKKPEEKQTTKKSDGKKSTDTKSEENKLTEKEIEHKKATEKKAEEKKSTEKKVDNKNAPEAKADEKKLAEKKVDSKKEQEKKADEKKSTEKKVDNKKTPEKKADDKKSTEKKVEDKKESEKKNEEKKSTDNKSENKKSSEIKSDEKGAKDKKPDSHRASDKKSDGKKGEKKVLSLSEIKRMKEKGKLILSTRRSRSPRSSRSSSSKRREEQMLSFEEVKVRQRDLQRRQRDERDREEQELKERKLLEQQREIQQRERAERERLELSRRQQDIDIDMRARERQLYAASQQFDPMARERERLRMEQERLGEGQFQAELMRMTLQQERQRSMGGSAQAMQLNESMNQSMKRTHSPGPAHRDDGSYWIQPKRPALDRETPQQRSAVTNPGMARNMNASFSDPNLRSANANRNGFQAPTNVPVVGQRMDAQIRQPPGLPVQQGNVGRPNPTQRPNNNIQVQLVKDMMLRNPRELQMPLQHTRDASMQHIQEAQTQHNREALMQRTREAPMQHTREVPMQHTREAPMQHNREASMQRTREAPMQRTREAPMQHTREAQMQHTREAQMQHTREVPMQHTREASMQHTREAPMQHTREALMAHQQSANMFSQRTADQHPSMQQQPKALAMQQPNIQLQQRLPVPASQNYLQQQQMTQTHPQATNTLWQRTQEMAVQRAREGSTAHSVDLYMGRQAVVPGKPAGHISGAPHIGQQNPIGRFM